MEGSGENSCDTQYTLYSRHKHRVL